MTAEAIFALRHPVLGEAKPFDDIPQRDWMELSALEIIENESPIKFNPRGNEAQLSADRGGKLSLAEQRRLKGEMRKILGQVANGETKLARHRKLLTAFRVMNAETQSTMFQMKIPDLGLKQGQVAGLSIQALDPGLDENDPVGGFTVLVKG